jgi:hypothetical protein
MPVYLEIIYQNNKLLHKVWSILLPFKKKKKKAFIKTKIFKCIKLHFNENWQNIKDE